MNKIKLRETIKDIKALDKSKDISRHMKNEFIKSKEQTEGTQHSDQDTPHSYAADAVSEKARDTSNATAYKAEQFGRKSLKKTPNTIRKAKANAVKIKQKIQGVAKKIKVATKTEKMARSTIKTSKQVAKTAQITLKTSQRAAQAARAAAKASVQAAKLTLKAVIAAVKATVAAVKGLITLIAAGGWVAVVIIIIICMVAFIFSSPFSIFYSGDTESTQNGITLTSAIDQINSEFSAEIERIKSENPHDEV